MASSPSLSRPSFGGAAEQLQIRSIRAPATTTMTTNLAASGSDIDLDDMRDHHDNHIHRRSTTSHKYSVATATDHRRPLVPQMPTSAQDGVARILLPERLSGQLMRLLTNLRPPATTTATNNSNNVTANTTPEALRAFGSAANRFLPRLLHFTSSVQGADRVHRLLIYALRFIVAFKWVHERDESRQGDGYGVGSEGMSRFADVVEDARAVARGYGFFVAYENVRNAFGGGGSAVVDADDTETSVSGSPVRRMRTRGRRRRYDSDDGDSAAEGIPTDDDEHTDDSVSEDDMTDDIVDEDDRVHVSTLRHRNRRRPVPMPRPPRPQPTDPLLPAIRSWQSILLLLYHPLDHMQFMTRNAVILLRPPHRNPSLTPKAHTARTSARLLVLASRVWMAYLCLEVLATVRRMWTLRRARGVVLRQTRILRRRREWSLWETVVGVDHNDPASVAGGTGGGGSGGASWSEWIMEAWTRRKRRPRMMMSADMAYGGDDHAGVAGEETLMLREELRAIDGEMRAVTARLFVALCDGVLALDGCVAPKRGRRGWMPPWLVASAGLASSVVGIAARWEVVFGHHL